MRLIRRAARKLLAPAALIAIALAVALAPSPASADTDLTGKWTFFFPKDAPESFCPDMEIIQTGSELTVSSVACYDGWELTSSFDQATRDFFLFGSLDGFAVILKGTVAEDGNTITGTTNVGHGPFGTFGAVRNSSVTPTPTPPPVGGIAFEPNLGALPLASADSSSGATGSPAGMAAAAAIAGVALAGAGAFALRRR